MIWFRAPAAGRLQFVNGRMAASRPRRLWLTDEYWERKLKRKKPDPPDPLVPSLFNMSLACMRESYTDGFPKLIGFGYYQNRRLLEFPDILRAASEERTSPGSATLAIGALIMKIKELWSVWLALNLQ